MSPNDSSATVKARPSVGATRTTRKNSVVDLGGPQRLRVAVRVPQGERRPGHRGQAVERLLSGPPVQKRLRGRRAAEHLAAVSAALEDGYQPIVLVERQTAQDDGVDDREDGGAGSDAEGQHGQSHHGERR